MIAKATDQKKVETSGVSEESVNQKNDFSEGQCERFYKALVMKLLMAQPGCKCELKISVAKKLPANAVIEPYCDNERGVVGIRVHAKQIKQKRGKVIHNKGIIVPGGNKP